MGRTPARCQNPPIALRIVGRSSAPVAELRLGDWQLTRNSLIVAGLGVSERYPFWDFPSGRYRPGSASWATLTAPLARGLGGRSAITLSVHGTQIGNEPGFNAIFRPHQVQVTWVVWFCISKIPAMGIIAPSLADHSRHAPGECFVRPRQKVDFGHVSPGYGPSNKFAPKISRGSRIR